MWKYGSSHMKLCIEKGLNIVPMIHNSFNTNTPLSESYKNYKQFLAQNLITEVKNSPYSPDLIPNGFWLFPKIKFALKGQKFQDVEDI
jgi:hypothetical protein